MNDLTTFPQPIGVCAIILNERGQILVGKRKNSYKAGYYGFPGGRIEVNEPMSAAIQREVLEETGLTLTGFTYVGVVRENQGNYDFIHFIYVVKDVSQTPQLMEPEKCEGWEWVDQPPEGKLLSGHAAGLELYMKQRALADLVNEKS